MIERVDRLGKPPVVGGFYLVPTVRGIYNRCDDDWPVMGPLHEDRAHLAFEHDHYHFDLRFLSLRQLRALTDWRGVNVAVAARVLRQGPTQENTRLPAPVFRRRKCRRSDHNYPVELARKNEGFRAIHAAYAGHKCSRGKAGLICPHRHFVLGSIDAVDGVVTCPLHGLQINAATGIVLRPFPGEPA